MRQSRLFSKTKKEFPKNAETVSHKYLVRGDFIDQLSAGIYSFLPLGFRVYKKIENIIREEMNNLGGQELFLPTLIPKKLWEETGRWKPIDPPLFEVKDRHKKEYGLGSTHEKVITDLIRKRISSYQDLPLALYQIQNKFRNEMRATGGLLRVREFLMKDLYSFHSSEKDLMEFYEKVKSAYLKIFKRCGLKAIVVEADSGTIGGKISHEFMVLAETGEDKVLICFSCGFGANIEKVGELKECPKCQSPLEKKNAIESGHIFNLGIKYSRDMKANFRDKDGKEKPIVMGCYGIGLGRLMAAIVEAHHDEKGIIWLKSIAPYSAHLLDLGNDKKIKTEAQEIYKNLEEKEVEVLYDDRDKSPGEKFADADLIGIPIRLVVSEKTLKKGCVEVKKRDEEKAELVKINKLNVQ